MAACKRVWLVVLGVKEFEYELGSSHGVTELVN